MKILIIGGTGFIGKHLINELKDGNELILLNRNILANQENIKFIQADRREIPLLKSTFANLKPEVICRGEKYAYPKAID
jgi:nucleoside-diphosphate-sugar epimerase